jgi:hypothetical protein
MAYINGKKICFFGVIFSGAPDIDNDIFIKNGILYVVSSDASAKIENDILCVESSSLSAEIKNDILYVAASSAE